MKKRFASLFKIFYHFFQNTAYSSVTHKKQPSLPNTIIPFLCPSYRIAFDENLWRKIYNIVLIKFDVKISLLYSR